MNFRKLRLIAAFGFAVFTGSATAQESVHIDTVFVGDAGAATVPYDYFIGTYEVTNAQYTAFLNAVAATIDPHDLYHPAMGSDPRGGTFTFAYNGRTVYFPRSDKADKPVNIVSFWDAARFANWLTTGDTETSVYVLTPVDIAHNTVMRDTTAWNAGGWAVASKAEWMKAAHFDPTLDGGDGGIWRYPTQSNSPPTVATANATGNISNPGPNVANYQSGADWNGQDGNVTTVGSAGAGSASYYGTFDQGGAM